MESGGGGGNQLVPSYACLGKFWEERVLKERFWWDDIIFCCLMDTKKGSDWLKPCGSSYITFYATTQGQRQKYNFICKTQWTFTSFLFVPSCVKLYIIIHFFSSNFAFQFDQTKKIFSLLFSVHSLSKQCKFLSILSLIILLSIPSFLIQSVRSYLRFTVSGNRDHAFKYWIWTFSQLENILFEAILLIKTADFPHLLISFQNLYSP